MSRGFKQTKPRNLLRGGDGGIKREVKAELGLKIRSAVGEQSDLGCGGGLVVTQTVEQVACSIGLAPSSWD